MNNRQIDDTKLEELLRGTHEQEPPVWLKQRIMKRIDERRPGLVRRFFNDLREPLAGWFSPAVFATATVCVIAAFWAGMLVERHTGTPETQPAFHTGAFADNARANYLIGRGLLAGDQKEASVDFFRKAVALEPNSAEYIHWQGVAYGTMGNIELERQSYVRTVQENPDYLPSLVNLGHSYLAEGNYHAALDYYRRVLQQDPHTPDALYNSALAYRKLGDASQERKAFLSYLDSYRTGKWALRAVEHLNQLGDFTYRSYRIGTQQIILRVPALIRTDSPLQQQEIAYLARVLRRTVDQEFHIVVYNQGDKNEAQAAALNLRHRLVDELGPDLHSPIRTSWFDAAETLSTGHEGQRQLSPSVLIFSNPTNKQTRRHST